MADLLIKKEHAIYDSSIKQNSMPIILSADLAAGSLYKMLGYDGALASNLNPPAGTMVGIGQYRNEGFKGEKAAVSGDGIFSIDTAVAIGTKIYMSTTAGALSDADPGAGYQNVVGIAIRDWEDEEVTDTTTQLVRLFIPVIG